MTETHISTRNDRRRGSAGVAALSLAAGRRHRRHGAGHRRRRRADAADSRPAPGCGPAVVARRWERVRLPAAARRRSGTLRGRPSRTSVPLAVRRRRRALRGRQSRIGLTRPPSSSRPRRGHVVGFNAHGERSAFSPGWPQQILATRARRCTYVVVVSASFVGRVGATQSLVSFFPRAGRHSRTVSPWPR